MRLASGSRLISSPLPHSSLHVMEQFSGNWEEACDGVMDTWTSRYKDRARPSTSNPGPILADEQGTRMMNFEDIIAGNSGGFQGKTVKKYEGHSDVLVGPE